jgi:hypothetical protein
MADEGVPPAARGTSPDAPAGKEKAWAEMTQRERDAVVALGWEQQRWDDPPEDEPLVYDQAWASLSPAQQAAAATLGMVAEEFEDFVKAEPEDSWGREPEPEPEPEPSTVLHQTEMDLSPEDELEMVRHKIHEFLDEVGIGSPGAAGATSNRGFDSAPLIEFAHDHKLHDKTADEIYAAYVEHQTMEIERALRSSEHESQSIRTLPEIFGPTSECMPGEPPKPSELKAVLKTICVDGGLLDEGADVVVEEIERLIQHVRDEWQVSDKQLPGHEPYAGHSHWERFVSEAGDTTHGCPPTEIWAPYTAEYSQKINNLIPRSGEKIETPDGRAELMLSDKNDATIQDKGLGRTKSKARATGGQFVTSNPLCCL